MPTPEQEIELTNVIGWIRIAKENLPTINDGAVSADQIAIASALLDRMHNLATALLPQAAASGRRAA